MTAPANRWKLGLFVVAGCAASLTGLTYLGMRELQHEVHYVLAYFDEAVTGLEEGSPVKFRGVTIGVVDEIRVASDRKHLRVQAALYDAKLVRLGLRAEDATGPCRLPPNLRAQLVMSWVTSTSFLQVDFFPDPPSGPQQLPFPVEEDTLRTVKSTAKSLEDASREVLRELPVMATSARELVELLRTELQGARLADVSRQLQAVLARIDGALQDLDRAGTIAGTAAAMAKVGVAADAVRDAAAAVTDDRSSFGATLAELRGLGQSLQREVSAMQLAATTASLRSSAAGFDGLAVDLGDGLRSLRTTLAAIDRLVTLLERDPGALLHGRAPGGSPLQEKR
ncbi:MAG: MCE family protein [Planctomycetes bacterium]|nr:MCE family protein [Planctomycetota bacterium]